MENAKIENKNKETKQKHTIKLNKSFWYLVREQAPTVSVCVCVIGIVLIEVDWE